MSNFPNLDHIKTEALQNILSSPQILSGKTPNAATKLALHETLHTPTNLIGSPHRVRPKTPSTNHSTNSHQSHQSSAHPENEEKPIVFGQNDRDATDSELEITDCDENDETYLQDIQNLNELTQLKDDLINDEDNNLNGANNFTPNLQNTPTQNLNVSTPTQPLNLAAGQTNFLQQALLALKSNQNSENVHPAVSASSKPNLPPAAVAAALTSRLNLQNQVNANLLSQISQPAQPNIPPAVNPAVNLQTLIPPVHDPELDAAKTQIERSFAHLKRKREPEPEEEEEDNRPHVKKPLNAFMLFMKEQRQKVVNECTLKESAAINQILGRKWHNLSKEEQQKYYDQARKAREEHLAKFPELGILGQIFLLVLGLF